MELLLIAGAGLLLSLWNVSSTEKFAAVASAGVPPNEFDLPLGASMTSNPQPNTASSTPCVAPPPPVIIRAPLNVLPHYGNVTEEASSLDEVPNVHLSVDMFLPENSIDSASLFGFDLWMSAYITNERLRANRWSRFDVFMWSMTSYSKLPMQRAYLFLEFAPEFQNRIDEVKAKMTELFGSRLKILRFCRLTHHTEWKAALDEIQTGEENEDQMRMVWFTNNDDHPFIDVDDSVLKEGIFRMRSDPARFKTMYVSHWPEILKLSGKIHPPIRRGSFVVGRLTILDPVQVFNFGYLRFLIENMYRSWKIELITRFDGILQQNRVWGHDIGFKYSPYIAESLQNVYVPLREQCRKFDGYAQQSLTQYITSLVLPPSANNISYGKKDLLRRMTAVKKDNPTLWNKHNNFTIPREWAEAMFGLYGHNDTAIVT
mmetsp:Transcript_2125/g.3886  ORF Transcript_2125/g.3886 Transcript_2125/m.3886 type:complete len:430 (-) Transcript_2125:218-1507(-)|eukprot:CAMPEP_0197516496 /NCGR_PEP_ID=MMETSP1318-20131121/1382_1 /TAXON_ID=552666 /ORGANISM="Partenskyella glossopodia, Strain RCC365" /LENGTH=429 /DNA_ID=CAMNT_0043065285 /DNA_START=101 /DNA_END=1390 /DNA_ORIENTATION=+